MAYDEELADRVRIAIADRGEITERKMFGGIAWMLAGNMACGVIGDGLLVRVGGDDYERALAEPYAGEMRFTGRPMRGFVLVEAEGVAGDDELEGWIDAGAGYAASLPAK